mmetsp:Transcript_8924/g.37774  ORF Transcript_8924/g.37774 Transcript_8924/m.37774 type:complete len:222 (+) Transcript_8924:720-1385(+)
MRVSRDASAMANVSKSLRFSDSPDASFFFSSRRDGAPPSPHLRNATAAKRTAAALRALRQTSGSSVSRLLSPSANANAAATGAATRSGLAEKNASAERHGEVSVFSNGSGNGLRSSAATSQAPAKTTAPTTGAVVSEHVTEDEEDDVLNSSTCSSNPETRNVDATSATPRARVAAETSRSVSGLGSRASHARHRRATRGVWAFTPETSCLSFSSFREPIIA